MRKLECEEDHLYFTRWFFKQRQNIKFRVNWHHHYIADTLHKITTGEIENVVINVSPGSSKTELVVINFIARQLAINPMCRFLHLSYSDDLALLNSQTARDTIRSDEYQLFWPMEIADDSKAKKRWNVMIDDKPAGGVYAASSNGQVTGFRAGHMMEGFWGAILIDDPIKPEDAYSETKLKRANRQLLSTIKSRKANPKTPIIVIMQRVGQSDPTQFIKDGALGGKWEHIVIPAVLDEEYVKSLPLKYQALIERDATERFSYWPYKEPIAELLKMEAGQGVNHEGQKISRFIFSSQYQQAPKQLGGNIIHGAWFGYYKMLPQLKYRKIFADTAQKTKERNDYSVLECWGHGVDGNMYLVDLLRGKWEAPELESKTIAFWNKHADKETFKPLEFGQLRKLVVEDKSSGTGLIQKLKLLNQIPVEPVERVIDKLTRVMDIVAYIEGRVFLPETAPFTSDFVSECESFTADDSHDFDDQIDPFCDAVNDMLASGNKLNQWSKII